MQDRNTRKKHRTEIVDRNKGYQCKDRNTDHTVVLR